MRLGHAIRDFIRFSGIPGRGHRFDPLGPGVESEYLGPKSVPARFVSPSQQGGGEILRALRQAALGAGRARAGRPTPAF
jgi:hypothetical protein